MKLQELLEGMLDDEPSGTYKNPLPTAPEEFDRVWEIVDQIDNTALDAYADEHGKDVFSNNSSAITKVIVDARNKFSSVQTVDIDKIIGSEPMLDGEHISRLVKNEKTTAPSGEHVLLFKLGNKYYALDGNHRIVAALVRGDKTINAQVIDTGV